ncbi:RNA polymerase sigma factor [Mucilaginibacter ginkgonis]|uniref:Sigma-70 family RNA polymerase sigma factor n=1 Tax=Mucilaginibacter ginkgonis TaxID=2682091 RepID=A0A6I4HYZ5_9SPHI|nr:sigma-70 family RNA polymerase sigma factor [Mucilaginibacter ginkgonis]QQL48564.1 sigma-70 family RNA polymerase sigma factor [Mucilaginibacter ginkgonis]
MPDTKHNDTLSTIKAYGKSLLSFIRKRVKNDADAEDILQDVWYQFSSVVNAEPIEQTGAWLYKVARNKISDKHKKHTEWLLDDLVVSDDEEGEEVDLSAFMMPDNTTPETEYLRKLFWDELYMALDDLPDEQKQVFIWHELDGLSFKDIAEITGAPEQTLVSRKRYAVVHLRKRLKQLYDEINNV